MRKTKWHSFSRYWKARTEPLPSTLRRRLSKRIMNLPAVLPRLRHYQSPSFVVRILICKDEVCWDFKGLTVTSRSWFGSMLQQEELGSGHCLGSSKPAWSLSPSCPPYLFPTPCLEPDTSSSCYNVLQHELEGKHQDCCVFPHVTQAGLELTMLLRPLNLWSSWLCFPNAEMAGMHLGGGGIEQTFTLPSHTRSWGVGELRASA